MASSLLERLWREKDLCEQSEPRLCLVKHPQNGTRDAPQAQSNTTPATKESLNFLILVHP